MSNSDFVIENGMLIEYTGEGGDVVIPDGVTDIMENVFEGCSRLTSIVIPDSVDIILEEAFLDCENLESVTIGKGLTKICDSAFQSCPSLKSVYYNGDISSWCNIGFEDCSNPLGNNASLYIKTNTNSYELVEELIIPKEVKWISSSAFQGCASITNVTMCDGVKDIGDYAFESCVNLRSVTISESVKSIGIYAFYECNNLTEVTLPDSITDIPHYAFSVCSALTTVTIGKGVKSIRRSAFEFCYSIRAVYYNGDIASWCSIEFDDFANPLLNGADLYIKNESGNYELLENLIIPDNITAIGYDVFKGCTSLSKVIIGNSVKCIYDTAFMYSTLTDVILGNGIQSLDTQFATCESLASIVIDKSVTTIDGFAFNECDLDKIFYFGTKSEFEKITIGELLSSNIESKYVTIYFYSDEIPNEEGNYWRYVNNVPTIW